MTRCRGIAMLITLMTMTVLLSGVAIIARVRVTNELISVHSVESTRAMDMIHASEMPIRIWLDEHAGNAVVAVEQPSSMIPVMEHTLEFDGQVTRIRITAWDQSGMIPRNAERIGLDFDNAAVPWKDESHPGLDQVPPLEISYPSPENPTAVGGLVATHNPWPSSSGITRARSNAVVNINTAPVALIEECFQTFNLGDPTPIIEKRILGEMAFYTTEVQSIRMDQVQLVSMSRVWSFRVDAWIGPTLRSSWCTYANHGGSWLLVQCIGISHD